MAKQYLVRGLGICVSGSKPPTPIRSQHPGLPPPLNTYSNQHIYFLCEPRLSFLMAKQHRVCSLGICISGSNTPIPVRSQFPGLPLPLHTYLHQLIYFICDSRHAFLMAKRYRAHSFSICFSGPKLPTPTRSQHPGLPAPPYAYSY